MDIEIVEPAPPPPRSVRESSLRVLRWIALGCAALTLSSSIWTAWDQGLTYDEPFHVRWAERLLLERDDNREQFRYDSKTPALIPAVVIGQALRELGGEGETVQRFATRLPSLLFLVIALALVARLARTDNPATMWLGLLLAALDPNLSAHASIATTDLSYTVVVLALVLALTGPRQTLGRTAMTGAIVGLAFAVKYSAVLLVPVAAFALLWSFRDFGLKRGLGHAFVAVASACLTMSACYLFVGVFQPLGEITLNTPLLKAVADTAPWLRLPIPASVLTGLDASIAHNDPDLWASYIFGENHPGGVWYYFLANWLMKTPLALIAAIFVGLWGLRSQWRSPVVLAAGALFLVHLGYFSLFFSTQIGLRFALPCVALACALAARGLGRIGPAWLLALVLFSVAERAPYWRDPIAFTNTSVWPKSRAFLYTADSNLDYGQNRTRLGKFAKESGLALVLNQPMVTPGRYVVGANELVIFPSRKTHRWLIENEVPAVTVGFTHFAFSIDDQRFEDYMNSVRMAVALDHPDDVCRPPLDHYPPGGQIPFDQRVNPEGGRVWVICTNSRKGADIGFRLTKGRAYFGRVTNEGRCETELIQEGQQAWFRIPPGAEVRLCIEEAPLRRSFLEYATIGHLTVRGQGADVELRQVPPDALK